MKTVYIDELSAGIKPGHGPGLGEQSSQALGLEWCHMWSDDEDALHEMARQIGVRRESYQDAGWFHHYELSQEKRMMALAVGAVKKSLLLWVIQRMRDNPGWPALGCRGK